MNFVDSNVIFAIAGCGEFDHCGCGVEGQWNRKQKTRRVLGLSAEEILSGDVLLPMPEAGIDAIYA